MPSISNAAVVKLSAIVQTVQAIHHPCTQSSDVFFYFIMLAPHSSSSLTLGQQHPSIIAGKVLRATVLQQGSSVTNATVGVWRAHWHGVGINNMCFYLSPEEEVCIHTMVNHQRRESARTAWLPWLWDSSRSTLDIYFLQIQNHTCAESITPVTVNSVHTHASLLKLPTVTVAAAVVHASLINLCLRR